MDHFVSLDSLPPGVEFPPQLRNRIHFDPATRRLVFCGYMSKGEFDLLCELSKDWGYRRKLEELFRLSVLDDVPGKKPVRRFFTAIARMLMLS
jgi:hypothetical protein